MKKIIFGALLGLLIVASSLHVLRILVEVAGPGQIDYGEGIVLYQATQVFDLKSAFHPLDQYPYIVFHYTPVYHIALRTVNSVLGNLLLSGRLVSMASAFWLIALFAWLVFRATRGYASRGTRWFGAAFAASWILPLPAMMWAPLARVDMLGLALQFTALTILCAQPLRTSRQLVAVLLLLVGIYTKQTLVAIPAAAILLLALIRPLRALFLAALLCVSGLAVLLILAEATHGGVIRHWILYNINPFHLSNALDYETRFTARLAGPIATAAAAFWLTVPALKGRTRYFDALSTRLTQSLLRRTAVGFFLAFAFGLVFSLGIGKEGANINYCLDWQLALCPLVGIFIVVFLRQWDGNDRALVFARPLVVTMLFISAAALGFQSFLDVDSAVGLTRAMRADVRARQTEDNALVRLIASFPGPVVSENMTASLQAGKAIPFEPAIIQQTTATGIFDENPLVAKTEAGYFDAFIMTDRQRPFFSERMLTAIRRHYDLYPFAGSHYIVYVRHGGGSAASPGR